MTATVTLDPSQERAVELMCAARFGVVTGGPGTGKTTCLRHGLDRLDKLRKRYALAAPTGKAAKRMHETTGREAQTIHRLLEFHPKHGFQRNRDNPIEADVVIIDEASMIDVELGATLFRAIDKHRTRVILIGDADQLPPVAPGKVFADVVQGSESRRLAIPLVRLQTLHRSAQQSWIHTAARRVLEGKLPDLHERSDFRFLEVENSVDILPVLRELVTVDVPRMDVDAQVLIPQHNGPAGIDVANAMLQEALNPRGEDDPFLPRSKSELRIGDRVIQTRNNYDLGVFNGEIGAITAIDKDGAVVELMGRPPVRYTLEQAHALQLAYALTVHRSQGSEWPWVICVVHSTHAHSLTRQLVYTAITRGKQGVIIVGNQKGLQHAVKGRVSVERNSALVERTCALMAAATANDSERHTA